jgi:hypothetical protein
MRRPLRKGDRRNGDVKQLLPDGKGGWAKPQEAAPTPPFVLADFLFDKQLKFVEDPRPFKCAVCSRRAGKSVACAADLVHTAVNNPDTICLYITLTRSSAKKIIWPEIKRLNDKYELGGYEDLMELSMTFPNGSVIYASGAKDASEIEKFRGLPLKKVYIDEAQSFRAHLKELIDDVIVPALMDHDGSLILIGTPGPVPAGYFAEIAGATKKEGQAEMEESEDDLDFSWVNYGWTFFDNPHIALKSKKTHDQVLKRVLKMRGVSVDDPSIQREFFGKWVMDADSLWIKYDPRLNHYEKMDERKKWNYILGIDIGFNDADALAVIAWEQASNEIYLVEELVTDKQDLTDLVEQIQSLRSRYNFSKMVIDSGGLGKKLAEEMRRRHKIPVHDADKVRKQENVAFLNAALKTGRFKARQSSQFAQDSYLVEIDRDKTRPDRVVLSSKYHSDIIDAVLYAFRESPAYAYEVPIEGPKKGTDAWNARFEDSLWEEALDHFKQKEEPDPYDFG